MKSSRHRLAALSAMLLVCAAGAMGQIFERTDSQREIELGRQAALEVERAVRLSHDARLIARVRRIGAALVDAMPERKYPYEFKVLDLQDFNAFCLPGGFMYVYEGLLNRLPEDDGVAFVMAHEITHASHRHWKRMAEKMRGPAVLAVLASVTTGLGDVAGLTTDIIGAGYSREQEDDADAGGVDLMSRAGYDPAGAAAAAEVMLALDATSTVPAYLRSHPPAKQRLSRLQARAAELRSAERRDVRAVPLPPTSPAEAPAGVQANELFPLGFGNTWTYDVRSRGSRTTYILEVSGSVPGDTGDHWRVSMRMPGARDVEFLMATTGDAVWRRSAQQLARAGWQHAFSMVDRTEGGRRWQIVGRETVRTPCGVFDGALHIRCTEGERSTDAWLAPRVGLVRRAVGDVVETLIAYDVCQDG